MENPTEKIREAVLDMMKWTKFVNDRRQHRYETMDGTWLQGVSTVSSIIPKDWLSAWGAKECAKFLGYSDYEGDTERAIEMMKKIGGCKTPEEYVAILKEAKGASARKSKESLVDGTKGHAWLETYVKAKMRGEKLPDVPTGTLERPIKQFLEWEAKDIDYWIISEARVSYPAKGYAGTLDAAAMMKNGRLAIVDFKFASHISEDYFLQTAGYQATFEPYEIAFDDRVIVRLPKTLEREEYDKEKHKYFKVSNDIEIKIVDTKYEHDRDVFFACLPVKQWINQFTK